MAAHHTAGYALRLGNDQELRTLQRRSAALLFEELTRESPQGGDMHAACQRAAQRLVSRLRPDLNDELVIPASPRYNREQVSPPVQQEVLEQIAGIVAAWMPIVNKAQDQDSEALSVARLLVDAVLDELAPDVLDSPVVNAPCMARAAELVRAYLLQARPNARDYARAAQHVLYLVVQSAAPTLLAGA